MFKAKLNFNDALVPGICGIAEMLLVYQLIASSTLLSQQMLAAYHNSEFQLQAPCGGSPYWLDRSQQVAHTCTPLQIPI